jgi:hypothetical protein
MPPAAVAVFVAVGKAIAASGIVKAVLVGAAVGAIAGAGKALINGENVLKGAVSGAVMGSIVGGVGKAVGMASGPALDAKVGEAGLNSGIAEQNVTADKSLLPSPSTSPPPQVSTGNMTQPTQASGGLLSGMGNWIEKNPSQAAIVSQTLGGAATGMMASRASDREREAQLERDRMKYDNEKIGGLMNMQAQPPIPSIATFAERPKWQMDDSGLLPRR